jgi:hypothetical protein
MENRSSVSARRQRGLLVVFFVAFLSSSLALSFFNAWNTHAYLREAWTGWSQALSA